MRWEYLALLLGELIRNDFKELSDLGLQGWEFAGILGERALFKRSLDVGAPLGLAQTCSNCELFPAEKDSDSGLCPKWNVRMNSSGTCGAYVAKQGKDTTRGTTPPVKDESSPWHLQPNTVKGEKRIEAVTDLSAGINSAEHRHKVVVIIGINQKVVDGDTDVVFGHKHGVQFLGMLEEADGHTHNFKVPGKL